MLKFAAVKGIDSISYSVVATSSQVNVLTEEFNIDLFLNPFEYLDYHEDSSLSETFDEITMFSFTAYVSYDDGQSTCISLSKDGTVYVNYKGEKIYVSDACALDATSYYSIWWKTLTSIWL